MNSHLLCDLTWQWLFYRNFHPTHLLNSVIYIWKEVSFLWKQCPLHWFPVVEALANFFTFIFNVDSTDMYKSLWPSKPVKPTLREGRGKRSSFREPFRLSCFFLKCCNKIIMTGKKAMPTSNTVDWALSLYSGTLIVTFICLILMSLNVSLMWCILTLPWRSISGVHLVPRLTGNHGLGMRFANNFVLCHCSVFSPDEK